MKRLNLTWTAVKALTTECRTGEKFYDSKTHGFGVKVFPTGTQGKRSWFCDYTINRKRRQVKLGDAKIMSPEKARDAARKVQVEALDGVDPLAKRKAVPTLEAWVETWKASTAPRLTTRGASMDAMYLARAVAFIGPKKELSEVTQDDCSLFYDGEFSTRGKTSANRALSRLKTCFNEAIRREHIVQNPARFVRAAKENPARSRTFSEDEMERLFAALDSLRWRDSADIIRVLAWTGCRLSEALKMKWSDLDLTAGIWVLQRTKSGAVVSRPLNIEVIMLLKRQDTSTEWVFPGRKGPRKSLFDAWEVVRKRAELVDAHIHDLRRTFGLMATRNSGLQVAQRLLGHSRISTTERVYAPLDTEDLRATVDLIGKATGKVKTTDRPTSEIKPGLN